MHRLCPCELEFSASRKKLLTTTYNVRAPISTNSTPSISFPVPACGAPP